MNGLAAYLINEINQTDEEAEQEYANTDEHTRKLIDDLDDERLSLTNEDEQATTTQCVLRLIS